MIQSQSVEDVRDVGEFHRILEKTFDNCFGADVFTF